MSHAAEHARVAPRQVGRYLAQVILVFAAYLIAGKLGQATHNIRSSNLGPVWPAYGIALAAILLCGYRVWIGVLLPAFLVAFSGPVPVVISIGQAPGTQLAALMGAYPLLRVAVFLASLS